MVFGTVQWSRVRGSGAPTGQNKTKCCAISWTSQRYKKKGKEGKTLRLAEPRDDEKTIDIEMRLHEMKGNEETTNAIVFTENSNFSSRYSLKLKMQSVYAIKLSMDPTLTLNYLKLKDHRFKLQEKGSELRDDGKKVYKFLWSTNDVPKTKNSKRFILSSALKVEGYKKFKYDMLVKFYGVNERSVYDGIQLSSISMEFIVPQDTSPERYDAEGDDPDDAEDEPGSRFHLINDMLFNTIEEDAEDD